MFLFKSLVHAADMLNCGVFVVDQERVVYSNSYAKNLVFEDNYKEEWREEVCQINFRFTFRQLLHWQRSMKEGILWQDVVQGIQNGVTYNFDFKVRLINGVAGRKGIYVVVFDRIVPNQYDHNQSDNVVVAEEDQQRYTRNLYSVIGHDMKNQLATTKVIADSLMSYEKVVVDDLLRKQLSYIVRVTDGSLELLDNLISWTKGTNSGEEMNSSWLILYDLVSEVCSLFYTACTLKELKIENRVDESLAAFTDKNILKTILRNLLSNAIKYSYRNQTITVSSGQDEEYAFLSVEDQGVGMDPEILKVVFEDNRAKVVKGTENEPGVGIGLNVCQTFARKIGGEILIESTKGIGTKVTVRVRRLV